MFDISGIFETAVVKYTKSCVRYFVKEFDDEKVFCRTVYGLKSLI